MIKTEKKLNGQKEILKLPYLVLCVSMLLTIGATYIFFQSSQAKDISRFQSEALEVKNRIEVLISTHLAMIKATRGFIESTEELDQQKFADFVNSLELVKNYSGIQGIGFTKRIFADEREEFVKKMQAKGFKDFKIFPESEKAECQAIIYLEPLEELKDQAIGFDMSTDPNRFDALIKARETGEATVTAKIDLQKADGSDKQAGFLIFLAVYKGGQTPRTVEERKRLVDGYVFSPFRAENFLRDVQNNIATSDIAITIYESERSPENILASTEKNMSSDMHTFVTTTDIDVAGRNWIVEYKTLPAFILQSTTGWTPLIFIGGLAFSLLLFGMTYLESFARAKAENITGELQESEREKAYLLEREQSERKKAEAANKAKDEFISIVSHELRTPLNAIAGWTKILYAENLSQATKKQALQKIDRNLRMQTGIVEELLEFSQILSGKNDLRHQEVDFSKTFEEVYSQISLAAMEKGVLLNKENSLNGQKVWGDSERLKRVIKNLLSNALKFTPKGGSVKAEIQEKDAMIEMIISDTGQGIKPEFLQHIFEHFKQADSSSTRPHGGLGLGLAITRHIIKLHGGTIKATSEGEGKGAVFTVNIPFNKQHAPRSEGKSHPPEKT